MVLDFSGRGSDVAASLSSQIQLSFVKVKLNSKIQLWSNFFQDRRADTVPPYSEIVFF